MTAAGARRDTFDLLRELMRWQVSMVLSVLIAVLMVVGNIAQVPHSLFDAAYPLPALIANNYGDMMSIPLYDAALLCAALILLVIILLFNIMATVVLKRFVK